MPSYIEVLVGRMCVEQPVAAALLVWKQPAVSHVCPVQNLLPATAVCLQARPPDATPRPHTPPYTWVAVPGAGRAPAPMDVAA